MTDTSGEMDKMGATVGTDTTGATAAMETTGEMGGPAGQADEVASQAAIRLSDVRQ